MRLTRFLPRNHGQEKKMHIVFFVFLTLFLFSGQYLCFAQPPEPECVILLHGSGRTKNSMEKMGGKLQAEGFSVVNWGYPFRRHTIEQLAQEAIPLAVESCRSDAPMIHFVTHSLGGIMVRYYLKHHNISKLSRVVMLSPPNGGSELVDTFGDNFLFKLMNSPATRQLGTDHTSLIRKLGKVTFELGVITGDRTINPLYSLLIPGPDDGKVSVNNAKVEGMSDFLVVHSSHPFIMRNREALAQTIYFLKNGRFERD